MKTLHVKRINITLPEQVINRIDRIAKKGDRSQFIARAVEFYVEENGKNRMRALLKEGAQKHGARDRALADEWFAVESEI